MTLLIGTKLKNISSYILLSLVSMLLLSCSGYMAELEQNRLERERVNQQQQLANDKQICKAYGFEEGSMSFSDCIMKLDLNRKKIAEMKRMRECEAVRRDNSQSGVTGFWGGVLMGARENLACN